jgi:hypothetical protein
MAMRRLWADLSHTHGLEKACRHGQQYYGNLFRSGKKTMKLCWRGTGQKIYGNLVLRWLWMEPDFTYYEIWSHSRGTWKLILEVTIK